MKLEQRVVDDVNYCIDTLASHLGVNIKERPKIVASEIETSYHDPRTNQIGIHASHEGDGIAYFEEAAHYLRDQSCPRKEDDASTAMDEFFGRLGESIGRKLVDKKHAYLFKGKKERKFSDPKLVEKRSEELMEALKMVQDVIGKRDERTIRYEEIYTPCSKHLDRLVEAHRAYRNSGNIGELGEQFARIGSELKEDLSNASKGKVVSDEMIKATLEIYTSYLGFFRDEMGHIRNYREQHQVKKDQETRKMDGNLKHCLDEARKILEEQKVREKKYGKFDSAEMLISLPLMLETHSQIIHFLGYIAAEDYAKQNPQFLKETPKLFRQSDEKIMEKFITQDVIDKYFDIAKKVAARKGVIFD